ncbi:MAG: hypothetical protein ACK53C_16230 [Pseudomonadota bacterium]
MAKYSWVRGSVLAALLAALAPTAHGATPAELSDFEAKAQYAYFTADANALRGLARTVRTLGESEDPLALYHYAHVQFRLLQLGALREDKAAHREAAEAGERCVAALDRALARNRRFAEALALQGSCYGYLATLGKRRAVTAGPRSGSRVAEAAKLDPRNPRVLLARAFSLWFAPAAFGGDREQAIPLFQQAAEAFERLQVPREGEPTWGAAEAWHFVGRGQEVKGDLLAARTAYEKALIVAPEFRAVQSRRASLGVAR